MKNIAILLVLQTFAYAQNASAWVDVSCPPHCDGIGRSIVMTNVKPELKPGLELELEPEVKSEVIPELKRELKLEVKNEVKNYTSFQKIESLKSYAYPIKNKLNIEGDLKNVQSIFITNVLGQPVAKYGQVSREIDVSNLPPGLYFLNIQTKKGVKVIKFIKE